MPISNVPGRVYVAASGDEGSLPNHARTGFNATAAVFHFTKAVTAAGFMQMWYTGAAPANVSLRMADTGATATAGPNACVNSSDSTITVCNYLPGQQFYPWKSSGPDRAVWMRITGHTGAGTVTITGTGATSGNADLYAMPPRRHRWIRSPIMSYPDG